MALLIFSICSTMSEQAYAEGAAPANTQEVELEELYESDEEGKKVKKEEDSDGAFGFPLQSHPEWGNSCHLTGLARMQIDWRARRASLSRLVADFSFIMHGMGACSGAEIDHASDAFYALCCWLERKLGQYPE